MPILTREAILNADDLQRVLVPVPEWGGEVFVRTMTGSERDRFEEAVLKTSDDDTTSMEGARALLASMTVVDEHGRQLFSEADIRLLGQKNAKALNRIMNVAQRLSGLTKADLKELTKNLSSGQGGASSSD